MQVIEVSLSLGHRRSLFKWLPSLDRRPRFEWMGVLAEPVQSHEPM